MTSSFDDPRSLLASATDGCALLLERSARDADLAALYGLHLATAAPLPNETSGYRSICLPFSADLKPRPFDLNRAPDRSGGSALAVMHDEAAALSDRLAPAQRDALFVIDDLRVDWVEHRERFAIGDPFWRFLLDLLAALAAPRRQVILPAGGWGLAELDEVDSRALEASFLLLATFGLQIAIRGSALPAPLRPFLLPATADPRRLPTVSIIMPVFNAEAYLAAAIDSILGQSFADFELICVNDGSTDGSAEVVKRAAGRDPRVLLVEQVNGGVSRARNKGLELASGRYLCFADADDLLLAHSLRSRVDCLDKPPEVLCGGKACFVDAAGRDLGMSFGRSDRAWYRHANGVPFGVTTLMGQAPVMRSVRFPEGVAHAEDWAYMVALLAQGWSIESASQDPLVTYRWHEHSATAAKRDAHLDGCLAFLDSIEGSQPQPRLVMDRPEEALVRSSKGLMRAKAQRLQAHFAILVFLGDDTGLEALLARPEFARISGRSKWLTHEFFDVAAVRAFRLPRQSPELDRAICGRLDFAFDACSRLPMTEGHLALSVALRRYLLSIAGGHKKGHKKKGALAPSSFARRLRLYADAAVLRSLSLLRLCRQAILGHRSP